MTGISQRGAHGVTPVVIRASVLGRVLGIRLLRLVADISLVPADLGLSSTVGPSSHVVTRPTAMNGSRDLTHARELLAHATRTLDETSHLGTARTKPGS